MPVSDRVPAMAAVTAAERGGTIGTAPPEPPTGGIAKPPDPIPMPGELHHAGDPSRRFVWLIPLLIAGVAVVVIALFAFGLLDGSGDTAVAPTTTTPVPSTTTVAPSTVPPAPATTAAPATTTTTTSIPEPASLDTVGEPIPVSSLTLRTGGIGPIDIGDAAPDAIGRLVASLGEPDEIGPAGEELGLCLDDEGRFVRWAGLVAVVSGTLGDGTFAGYRYAEEAIPRIHLDLATPSGLRLGDPISTLNRIYASYQIDYVSVDGAGLFRLSDGDGLLLWGPVSSIEDSGRVEGIYGPDACPA